MGRRVSRGVALDAKGGVAVGEVGRWLAPRDRRNRAVAGDRRAQGEVRRKRRYEAAARLGLRRLGRERAAQRRAVLGAARVVLRVVAARRFGRGSRSVVVGTRGVGGDRVRVRRCEGQQAESALRPPRNREEEYESLHEPSPESLPTLTARPQTCHTSSGGVPCLRGALRAKGGARCLSTAAPAVLARGQTSRCGVSTPK